MKPAARAFKALFATAHEAGHNLKTDTPAHSYRTYAQQVATFKDHYTTTYLPGRPYKVWQGQRWYQKYGEPVVALPGTSNHGWARAVDTGEERDGDVYAEMFDTVTLNWLIANEQRFGISHEIQSEPWHLRYFAGDIPPKAVLAYEASLHPEPDPEPTPTPTHPQEPAVTYFYVKSVGKYFCVRPWAPAKIELTDAEGFALATDNPGLVIEVRTATLFNKMISGHP